MSGSFYLMLSRFLLSPELSMENLSKVSQLIRVPKTNNIFKVSRLIRI